MEHIYRCNWIKKLLFTLLLLPGLYTFGYDLPAVKDVPLQETPLPTSWQTVIFRNYGYVVTERIAQVLSCDVKTIEKEAQRMGLSKVSYNPIWEQSGYITIIRNNWYLLPYDQLMKLLNFDEQKLAWILQEEDFLSVKLGGFKPQCPEVKYSPLNDEQLQKTNELAVIVRTNQPKHECSAFQFFSTKELKNIPYYNISDEEPLRMIHGYLSPCGDIFMMDSRKYMPDQLLKAYADAGINAIFLHSVLSTLSPYPFDETRSQGYEQRRQELKRLIQRCQRFGIKVYLYMNEPRNLCTSRPEVKTYLHDAIKDLVADLHDLGGIMTITMSENQTHCKSHSLKTNCELCKDRPVEEMTAEVNNIIYHAIQDAHVSTRLIANLWGWAPYMGWTDEQTFRGIELLDKGIGVLCVSEFDLAIEKAGIKSVVGEYSISNPGPSERTCKMLAKAKENGHKILAKVQINNSWECATVPYMPVFDLELQHLQNLRKIDVKEYMLTWTLGGYPSPMLSLVAESAQPDFNLDKWYQQVYGKEASQVHAAVNDFCNAFQLYPYVSSALYFSPKNMGMANLWSLSRDGKTSSMVGFSFDDYERWTGKYPVDVYMTSMNNLLETWKKGLAQLAILKSGKAKELYLFAQVVYLQYQADLLHTKYAVLKRNLPANKKMLTDVIKQAEINTQSMLQLIGQHPAIAYEASNCYFFTSRNLLEKLMQLHQFQTS